MRFMKLRIPFILFLLVVYSTLSAVPVRNLPGLVSVTFIEGTGGNSSYTFNSNGPEITNRLSGTLNGSNRDFFGGGTEHYDVFYSDSNGNLDINGEYVSVEVDFKLANFGGGLNISMIQLNFTNSAPVIGSQIGSFVGFGNGYVQGSELNAIDGNINSYSRMGNNIGSSQRLRITVGGFPFGQNQVPTLSQWSLIILGLVVLCIGAIFIIQMRGQLSKA